MKMHTLKTLATGLLALALASAASASVTTIIHLTGSTAFRSSTMTNIEALMGSGAYKVAYVPQSGTTSEKNANFSIISGTIGGNDVIFKCHWTGSTGGIQTVVQNLTDAQWLANSVLPAIASNTPTVLDSSTGPLTPAYDAASVADVTMEDSHQASTGFNSPALVEQKVGIVVFDWVANNGSPSGITNMTPLLAQSLVSGVCYLSQFTGLSADSSTFVYAAGRNFDSGTRLSELAESGVGVFGSVQQVQTTGTTGTGGLITAISLYPAETILGISFADGQSGYASGGTLANVLATPGSNAGTVTGNVGPGWLVGYLGRSDVATATVATNGNTARKLTWNGVADTDNNVIEGLYTAWEYEWLAYRSSFVDGAQTAGSKEKTIADALANGIKTFATSAGPLISQMHVSRAIEGGVVTHN